MAKAIVQKRWEGEPWEKLELVSRDIPQGAKPGHVLIRLKVRAVHPLDLLLTRSNFLAGKDLPDVITGSEGVGVVEAVSRSKPVDSTSRGGEGVEFGATWCFLGQPVSAMFKLINV